MAFALLISSVIIFACVIINKISFKIGIPTLVFFIFLGMIFGSEGIGRIYFKDYKLAEKICVIALIFIMFYGGFGTNWNTAKSVIKESVALATLGVAGTALITGTICYLVFRISFWESILLGSVIGSTDAASVFSILRSKKLGIKENTAPVLEVESGSNDPFAYICMVICITVLKGRASGFEIVKTFLMQVTIAVLSAYIIARVSIKFLRSFTFDTDGFDKVFFVSLALFSYALPENIGGNGFLTCYIVGIVLGNTDIKDKKSVVHFFDGVTNLMQLVLFFLLGLLAFPHRIYQAKFQFLIVFLVLTFIARPVMVFLIYAFKKDVSLNKKILVSFCGLRGAASIVFAIMVLGSGLNLSYDIFHIVFGVVLLSIIIQGWLIPLMTKILDMIDENENIMKTFSDYTEDMPIDYIEVKIKEGHHWLGKSLKQIHLPNDLLIVAVQRDKKTLVPDGNTRLSLGDSVVITAHRFQKTIPLNLTEKIIGYGNSYIGRQVRDISKKGELIILVVRQDRIIIPSGETYLMENDTLIVSNNI